MAGEFKKVGLSFPVISTVEKEQALEEATKKLKDEIDKI